MGRQVYFYMTEEDEDDFLEYVRTTGDVVIIPQTQGTISLTGIENFRTLAKSKFGEGAHLWNKAISPPPVFKHYESGGYYCVDFLESEVINVTRSKSVNGALRPGRLHIEAKISGNNVGSHAREKGAEFLHWYSVLAKWIRKHYEKQEDGTYVGRNAFVASETGLKLG